MTTTGISLPEDVIASLERDDGEIRIGDDVYRWLLPDQSAKLREAVTAIMKPTEDRPQAEALRHFLLLLRDLHLGDARGPVRKFSSSDLAPEGHLVRFVLVRTATPDKQLVEEITLQFVAEQTLLARLARGEPFRPTGKSLLRLLHRFGDKCFPWLLNWTYETDARDLREGRLSRMEDKIEALRFTAMPEVARLMAAGVRHGHGKAWLTSHPVPAARGLTRTFMNLARGMAVLVQAGHRELIVQEASALSPLDDEGRQLLERLLDAAAAPYTPPPKEPARVEVGLFGNSIDNLDAARFDIEERRSVKRDADLKPGEKDLVKMGLASIAALHDHKFKSVEAFLKAVQEDDIQLQTLTDRVAQDVYTLVIHHVGDNAAGFALRNVDRVAVAEVQDGALAYDPASDWP